MNLPQVPEGHQTEPARSRGSQLGRFTRPTPRTRWGHRTWRRSKGPNQPQLPRHRPKPPVARDVSKQPGHTQPATTVTLHFNAKSPFEMQISPKETQVYTKTRDTIKPCIECLYVYERACRRTTPTRAAISPPPKPLKGIALFLFLLFFCHRRPLEPKQRDKQGTSSRQRPGQSPPHSNAPSADHLGRVSYPDCVF